MKADTIIARAPTAPGIPDPRPEIPVRRLSAPKAVTFLISLLLVGLAVATLFVHVPVVGAEVAAHRFWVVVAGYALLAAGCLMRGL